MVSFLYLGRLIISGSCCLGHVSHQESTRLCSSLLSIGVPQIYACKKENLGSKKQVFVPISTENHDEFLSMTMDFSSEEYVLLSSV